MILLINKFYSDDRKPAPYSAKLTYTGIGGKTAIIHTIIKR